jgi:hypothetical protein
MSQQDNTPDQSEQIRQAACLLLEHPAVLEEILALGSARECRNDGIPAILIIEEFGVPQQKRQPMPGDETLGFYYAVLATALTMLVDMKGGDPVYPSVCPAMSAIAEKAFKLAPFEQFRLSHT